MKLLGLTGLAGSGKSSVADYLEERYFWGQMAFADPLKEMAKVIVHLRCLEDREAKELLLEGLGVSPRQIIQHLGQGLRQLDPDFWVKLASIRLNSDFYPDDSVVISDVRYDNEADMVHRYGGKVIQIIRPGITRINDHPSEDGINPDRVDYVLYNDGVLEDLGWKVNGILWSIGWELQAKPDTSDVKLMDRSN